MKIQSLATAVAFASTLQGAVATFGWHNAPSYSCPIKTPEICVPEQHSGFNWHDLVPGPFGHYGGFNFEGFTCKNSFGGRKRDALLPRTFGPKCISGEASHVKSSCPKVSASKVDKFSITHLQVSVEFDCDLEFHYTLPDNSICKQKSSCKKTGTVVENNQCGGAKDVVIVFPKPPTGIVKKTCSVGIHSVGFHCPSSSTSASPVQSTTVTPPGPETTPAGPETTPAGPETTPAGPETTPAPIISVSSNSPVYNTTVAPPVTVTTVIVEETVTTCPVTNTHVTSGVTSIETTLTVSTISITTTKTYCPKCTGGQPGPTATPSVPETIPAGPETTPAGAETTPAGPETTPAGPETTPGPIISFSSNSPVSNTTVAPPVTITTVIVEETVTTCPVTNTHVTSGVTSVETTLTVSTISITTTKTYCPGCTGEQPGPTATPSVPETIPAGPETTPAGLETTPAGAETTPAGAETTPAGPETTPAGPETTPAGSAGPETTPGPVISFSSNSPVSNTTVAPPVTITTVIVEETVTTCPVTNTHVTSGVTSVETTLTVSTIAITTTKTYCPGCTESNGPYPTATPVTSTSANSPVESEVPESPCPPVLPQCLNTWLPENCSSNSDTACYCPSSDFTTKIFECLTAYGASQAEIDSATAYFQGICAPYIPTNPDIIVGAPPCNSTQPGPVTTIILETTLTGSSTIQTISTQVTVPQVVLTTVTGSSVHLVPGTAPQTVAATATVPQQTATSFAAVPTPAVPSPAVPTPAVPTPGFPVATGGSVGTTTIASPTAKFTGAASRGSVGAGVLGAAMAFAVFVV